MCLSCQPTRNKSLPHCPNDRRNLFYDAFSSLHISVILPLQLFLDPFIPFNRSSFSYLLFQLLLKHKGIKSLYQLLSSNVLLKGRPIECLALSLSPFSLNISPFLTCSYSHTINRYCLLLGFLISGSLVLKTSLLR